MFWRAETSVRCACAIASLLIAGTVAARATDGDLAGSSLGAHTLLTQAEDLGTTPARTSPVATQKKGSALLVFTGGYSGSHHSPVDSYGNHWKQVGKRVAFRGYDGRFDVGAYLALDAKGGADHTLSVDKGHHVDGEISIPFIEIRHAGRLQDVAQNYPQAGLELKSGSVTTTGPATLVALWWGDAFVYRMTAAPNNGFKVIDSYLTLPPNSGVQCAVAVRQVAGAGVYDVSWIGAPSQGAVLWLLAFQS